MCVPKAPPGKHSGTHAHPRMVSLPDAAAKHAALGFFDCLRAEVEEYDVIVSTVSPSFIRSYRVHPGQGNWEDSIWKRELSERSQRDRGRGGLWRGGGSTGVFLKHGTGDGEAPAPS